MDSATTQPRPPDGGNENAPPVGGTGEARDSNEASRAGWEYTTVAPPVISAIPESLKSVDQWVNWRLEPKPGKSGMTKVPYCSTNGRKASCSDPNTWADLDTAVMAFDESQDTKHQYSGIGFQLVNDGGIVGVDLDHCIDPETGDYTDDSAGIEARRIVEKFDSYTEVSPSGAGLRIFLRGTLDRGRKKNGREIYASGRYLTVTGNRVDGSPATVESRQEAITWMVGTYFVTNGTSAPGAATGGSEWHSVKITKPAGALPAGWDDTVRDDPDLASIWNQDRQGLDQDQSRYDAALALWAVRHGYDDQVIANLIAEYRQHTGNDPDKGQRQDYLQRTIHNARELVTTDDGEPEELTEAEARALRAKMLDAFNLKYAVSMIGGKAFICRRVPNARGHMETEPMDYGSVCKLHHNSRIPVITQDHKGRIEIKWKPIVAEWMAWTKRSTFDRVKFEPIPRLVSTGRDMPIGNGSGALNLYCGMNPDYAPAKGDCSLILSHIWEVWASKNEDVYRYLMSWLARMLQQPNERGHTVIVLKSGEGTGKNIIADILANAFGSAACVISKQKDITGDFNYHLALAVLAIFNEACWGGQKEAEGTLKQITTDESFLVNRKHITHFPVSNVLHILMMTNNDWVVPAGLDDRRYFTIQVSDCKKGDFAYFKRLSDHIADGGAQAFIHHLINANIAHFDPRDMPKLTGDNAAFKAEQKIEKAGSVQQWWRDVLATGECWVNADVVRPHTRGKEDLLLMGEQWAAGDVLVPTKLMHQSYLQWCREHGAGRARGAVNLGRELSLMVPGRVTRQKVTDPTIKDKTVADRVNACSYPKLAEARLQFQIYLGEQIEW